MQGNYVKLLHQQVRDLGKCDGRGSVLDSPSRKPHTDFHTMSGVLGLAAEIGESSHAPVVRIEVVIP